MDMPAYLELVQGIRVERAGALLRANCPFHGERTPSFYLFPDGHAYCFGGCDEASSRVRDIVELIYRLEFPGDPTRRRAFDRARELGAISESASIMSLPRITQLPLPTEEQIETLTLAFNCYREFFQRRVGVPARRWLFETRKLDGPQLGLVLETVGYAPEGGQYHAEVIDRLRERYGDQWVTQATIAGLLNRSGGAYFRNRIMFAVRDKTGRVLYLQGRTLNDERPYKYLNSRGIRKQPYEPIPPSAALYEGTHMDEGALDAAAHGANGFYALALLGSRIPPLATLKGFSPPIINGLDNEPEEAAGGKGRKLLQERCQEAGIPHIDGVAPDGIKDASEWLATVGKHRFSETHRWRIDLAA